MVYSLELLGVTFDFVGKVLIALMALLVHKRVRREGKIDQRVLKRMGLEQIVGLIAVLFLIAGYAIHSFLIA